MKKTNLNDPNSEMQLHKATYLQIIARRVIGYLLETCTVILDFRASKKDLCRDICNDLNQGKARALVSVFCNTGEEADRILKMNEVLSREGFEVIVVNNGQYNSGESLSSSNWIVRKNLGRDFAAWKDIIAKCKVNNLSELILINDTCFWSEEALAKFISYARQTTSDVTCATTSNQRKLHMQSYIMYFKRNSIIELSIFFKSVKNWRFKRTIVKKGELELSEYLIKKGIKFDSWVKTPQREYISIFNKKYHASVNPINYHSQQIANEYGFYKIKNKIVNHDKN